MSRTTDSRYLTVAQVAETLGITPDGVYKLISRNKLPAVRRSERGLRVTRLALEAYRKSLGRGPDASLPQEAVDAPALRATFETETGRSPEEWVAAWRRDEIADSAENDARLVQALALRDRGEHGAAVHRERWAAAAFAAPGG
jgi:excisionase family DNA binding protein